MGSKGYSKPTVFRIVNLIPLHGINFFCAPASQDSMTNGPTRRAAVVTGLALFRASASVAKRSLKVAAFSKHLQFLEGPELAQTAAGLGFDGIDITVRAGGHIEPAEV